MRKVLASALICLLGAISAEAAIAQDRPIDFSSKGVNVFSAPGGQSLSLSSQAAPAAVVATFLHSQGYLPETLASLVVTSEGRVSRTGLRHLRFAQEVEGLTVYSTYVKAAVNDAGELVHLIENLATPSAGGLLPTVISERVALDAALDEVHPGVFVTLTPGPRDGNTVRFSGDDFFYQDPTVTQVAIPMQSGVLQEGYLVETWTQDDNLLHHTLVGGAGRVLRVELRTNNDSYNIFPDHPGNSSQTVTTEPDAGNVESPIGWLFAGSHKSHDISGNNVHAYLDTDNNGAPDPGGISVTAGNFLTGANLGESPSTDQNKDVAVQNLFYFNNVIHDKLYDHGFIENVGNFQEDNFGNGGQGSDSVNAEAQDGGGTNDANFATPSDGSNPRMQMYIWTQSTPKRDGDLDSDIIWHEYGHGLTWRMIGNMNGVMSGAIGEGMSDALSILANNNDVVGEYSTSNSNGVRSAPYTNYGRTYGDMGGSSVHSNGEIYAATIWRLWEIFQANSLSLDTLYDYLIGGMNFTPSGPAFEDMRDGILAAVPPEEPEQDVHKCLIWEAFADFGIGIEATSVVSGGNLVSVTESFDVPAECGGGSNTAPNVSITAPTGSLVVTLGDNVDFAGTASDYEQEDLTASLAWTSDIDDAIGSGGSFSTTDLRVGVHTITASVTDIGGLTESATVEVTVNGLADVVTITKANYNSKKDKLDVDATGSAPEGATLMLHVLNGGNEFMSVEMSFNPKKAKYSASITAPINVPTSVRVTSSGGGEAASDIGDGGGGGGCNSNGKKPGCR